MPDVIEAIVTTGASVPSDTVLVKLPDEPRPVVVEGWTPRSTALVTEYPAAGDTALVVESDRGRIWLLSWISE
jgi:hypothetical protein